MNSKKVLMILMCVLILIIIIVLIILNSLKKRKEEEQYAIQESPILTTSKDIVKLNNENEFFTVQECVKNYFDTLNNNSVEVYYLLNNTYIEKNKINSSNVLQKVYQLENGFEEFFAKDIYYREVSYDREYQYYIYGEILGENYNTIQSVYIIANLDFENMSFNISFSENNIEIGEQAYLSIIENLKKNNTNEFVYVDDNDTGIELNQYNKFKQNSSQTPYELERYLKNYTTMAVYYPDIAYNLLDEEYRNKRFGSLAAYEQYVLDNKYRLLNSTVKEYNISEKDDYCQYLLIDTNANYYIFKVTDIMKYSLVTDFYTIELEELANRYDASNVQERGSINIQKIASALNSKDYEYVYDKLDEGFKANKYPTYEVFKNYMSGIIIGNYDLTFENFRNEGEIYIYNIKLESSRASAGDPVNMQIIMKLKENRDFVMSFSIQNSKEE